MQTTHCYDAEGDLRRRGDRACARAGAGRAPDRDGPGRCRTVHLVGGARSAYRRL